MAAEIKPDLRLEIAHVLFIDIVGTRSVKIHVFRKSWQDRNRKPFTNSAVSIGRAGYDRTESDRAVEK